MDEVHNQLLSEQFCRLTDQINAQFVRLERQFEHRAQLICTDIAALRADVAHANELATTRLARLERETDDHEMRIRAATEGVTQFKLFSGLTSGTSTIMAAVAFFKALF